MKVAEKYIRKFTCYVFPNKRKVFSHSLGNPTFSNTFPRARHVLMTFELRTLCVSFRCIFLICSRHLSKHLSLCELF